MHSSPSALVASWSPPQPANGIITGYRVSCYGDSLGPTTSFFNSSERFVVIDGFKPFTIYTCSVRAFTGAGIGSASEEVVARTAQDCKSQ